MAWRKTLKGKWSSYSSYSELNSDHHQLSSWEHIKENQQIVDLNSKMVAIFALFHNIWSPTPSPHKTLYYSDDTSNWQSTFYSPLFILYWRQQIPPPFSLKILWSPKSCNHFPPSLPPSQGENTDWSQSKAFIYRGDSPSNFWLTIQQTVRRFIFISENHYCLMLQLK